MAKKTQVGTILPHDTFFYTIPFEQPHQRLTRDMLKAHYLVPKGRRAHMGIHTEYKAFKNGIISVEVKSPDNSKNMLFMHVGLTELDVACTCGMPGGKLCYHAYMGLHSLAWYHYLDLASFYWPGLTADDTVKNTFLTTTVNKNWISVRPKPKYGNLFKSSIGFADENLLSINIITKHEITIVGGQEAIAYCLAYNLGYNTSSLLPLLIPCLGLTSKNNKDMVSFKQFSIPDKPIQNFAYTANQVLLNDICFKVYDIAKTYDSFDGEAKRNESPSLKHEMLTLWEQAIPLLLNEKYNFRYYTYWLKYLKEKPRKGDIKDCSYSLERPVLSFVLKFHQDHFSLAAVVSIDGKPLKFDYKPHLFVFDEITKLCYLMPSVQDDDLLMWILTYNNRLTILKKHFKEFHSSFLERLSSCYPVFFIQPSTKKGVPYRFEMISNEIM
jgi:hypothetical protein